MKFKINKLFTSLVLIVSAPLSFGDTLTDIYELALKNDATLKAAEATYRSNIEYEKQALSTIMPQISASASYAEQDIDTLGFNQDTLLNNQTNRKSDMTSYKISIYQNLFDLSAWFSLKEGKEFTLQAKAQLASDQQDLVIRVAEAYFNVLSAQDNLSASKAEERATKRQLEQTQQRFDVGLIAITEVHEARAVFDSTVVRRLTDEGNLGTALETVTVITGQSHSNLWELNKDFPIVDPDPIARNEWVDFALRNNYKLKAALHAMEAARHDAKAKKMKHAPTLAGSYQYSDDETNTDLTNVPDGVLDSETDGGAWRIELSIPIYAGGLTSSQRRQAHEQYNTALQNQIGAQRNVIRNTRASHINVATDVQRVKARSQAIVSTRSALDATQAGYEVGTRNIVDVLQAQRSLYGSIRDYANSRYDYVINMLKLKKAAGTLSPQDIIEIGKWLVAPGSSSMSEEEDKQTSSQPLPSSEYLDDDYLNDEYLDDEYLNDEYLDDKLLDDSLDSNSYDYSAVNTFSAREQDLLDLPSSDFVLQLIGTFKETEVEKFVSKYQSLLPVTYFETRLKDKPWFVGVTGPYNSRDKARQTIGQLPNELKRLKPWVRSLTDIHSTIRDLKY